MYTFRQTNRKTLILASLAAGLTLGIAAATYATVVGTSTFAGPDDPRGGAPAEEIPNPGSVPAIPKVERDPVPDKVEPPSSPICEGTPRVCAAALSIGAAARGGSPAVLRLFEAFASQCPNETHPDDRSGCKQRPGESLEVVAFTLGGKEASLLPLAELDRFLRDWLAKPGPIAIAAVGCPQPDRAVRPDCSTGFATTLVISAGADEARSVVLLGRLSADGQPRLFGAYFGTSNEVAVVGGRQQVAGPTVDNLRWFYFQRWLDQAGSAAIRPAQAPAKPPVSDDSQVDPRPIGAFQFWNPQVGFDVYPWDNRAMSDADRQKDPVYNPAWPYFETCMQSAGAPVRASSQARFAQTDLTAFLVEINRTNPDPKANFTILQTTPTQRKAAVQPGSGASKAVAFLECADQWLTKSSKEVFEATGVPNEYYPSK